MTARSLRGAIARTGAAGMIAVLLAAGAPAVLAANHAVDIAGFAFSPGSVTVTVGDTVRWANADAQGHTATADDGSFDTGTIAGGTSKSVTFATAGTFPYHCKIHAQMTGTVVVEAAAVGGGGGATQPPTDTIAPPLLADTTAPAEHALLALAALGGVLLARRRFGRAT